MTTSVEVRERIISYARVRLFREGVTKISVDEMMSELAMSKKTFYRAFDSKDELIEQIAERMLGEINTSMERILGGGADFVHKLHELIAYLSGMLGGISKGALQEIQRHQPHVWRRIEQFRRERLTRTLTRLLQQGIGEGFIRGEVNTRVFLLAYLASVESIMRMSVLSSESFSEQEAAEAIMDIFFRGILTDSARAQLGELQHNIPSHSAQGPV